MDDYGTQGVALPPSDGDRRHWLTRRWGTGEALFGLLRRPAAYAWVPLAVFASLSTVVVLFLIYGVLDVRIRPQITGTLTTTFAALIGLLVGQSIKELQHCRFSWGLPGLRARLFPGAVAIGLFVALFAREIFVAIMWPFLSMVATPQSPIRFWQSFPPLSLGMVALSFLAFWIGVRPSVVTVTVLLAVLTLSSPLLLDLFAQNGVLVALATAPLTAYLMYETFSVRAARRQPFVPTRTLTGVAWSRSRAADQGGVDRPARDARRNAQRGPVWPSRILGTSIPRWIHAGWHENHGAMRWVALIAFLFVPVAAGGLLVAMVIDTIFRAPALWFIAGYGRLTVVPANVEASIVAIIVGSMIIGVPLAVFCAAYGSISLRRVGLYPLSRRRLANIEYWGSLAESFIITGFATAILMGFWVLIIFADYGVRGFDRWPPQVGSDYGWALVLMRALAFLFIVAPLAQYIRLRYVRGAGALSPVAQLLTLFALAAPLTVVGITLVLTSMASLSGYPLVLHVAVFVTVAMMSQYLYRRAVDRHFASADLV